MQHFEDLLSLISSDPIQYIDIPLYLNMGDHLIAHGTFEFIRQNHINVRHAMELDYYPSDWLDSTNVVVFGGGGNFGDLYPQIHVPRKKLIARLKNKRLIVLPQSIFYKNNKKFQEDIDFFRELNDFHLFTRDRKSYLLAKELTNNAYLVPDMAFFLKSKLENSYIKQSNLNSEPLYFYRKDNEKRELRKDAHLTNSIDWSDIVNPYKANFYHFVRQNRLLLKSSFGRFFISKNFMGWQKRSWNILEKAINILNAHPTIYTDRLHVMILSNMLRKKTFVLDNNLYGKLRNYYISWPESLPYVEFLD